MENIIRTEHLEDIPDKDLLELCIKAFEIAIAQIKKLENSEITDKPCEQINPDDLDGCAGSTNESFVDVCQICPKYIKNTELMQVQKKMVYAMKMELEKYIKERT